MLNTGLTREVRKVLADDVKPRFGFGFKTLGFRVLSAA